MDSFCRVCNNHCAIKVELDDSGSPLRVRGNSENPVFGGYTCVKGRSQIEFLRGPERLRHSLKRGPDGEYRPIPVEVALDEIAQRLSALLAEHDPRSIASYAGIMAAGTFPTAIPLHAAFFDAVGTRMRFDPNTIDKGGKQTAASFLGSWSAPSQGFHHPEAILLIGINPLMTYTGFPTGSPHTWLKQTLASGCKLIVIDPRRTDVAKRATLHLQAAPGHDCQLVASLIHVILRERLYDREFVGAHVSNVDVLERAVESFDPYRVAKMAGVEPESLVEAARMYAGAKRGYAMAGTGPNMAGSGTLLEYLVLGLETLCGRWMREGEVLTTAPALLPGRRRASAGAKDPTDWRRPEAVRARGLHESTAGMPSAALPDEILADGPGRVRALVSWAGNPAVAFPDQRRTISALESLDLLVQVDPWMSETARHAHYVIAPTLPLEVPSITTKLDALAGRATGYGLGQAYAQYSPAVVDRPADSDLIEDWEFFYGLMVRMGFPVRFRPAGAQVAELTLTSKPTTDELLELATNGSRVPLSVVKTHPGGDLYLDDLPTVGPPTPDDNGRLDVGNAEMLAALAAQETKILMAPSDRHFPLRLLCRRNDHVYNSSCHFPATDRGVPYNPAYLHPEDLAELSVQPGTVVTIRSALGEISAVAEPDADLRRGVVSMAFGYGPQGDDGDVRRTGSSTNRLVSASDVFDPYTGQPRMSNVPVSVTPRSPRGRTVEETGDPS
ncbi:MAG TPA: molybdopterin-dependent oxidoreductase [Nocardioides sp.]|uniref:molybdopterin-containing oxidoreductase family protein n=1 Tax=Nocardioides sp. TaxID=35761 RepID=UPI002E338D3B|nr:molybdopterin-dependent oxidoreductase [Nocardioides sp.]HEX3930511.1 molybdopterin-dependent oxidoreductase [Nocardioides sp.]